MERGADKGATGGTDLGYFAVLARESGHTLTAGCVHRGQAGVRDEFSE